MKNNPASEATYANRVTAFKEKEKTLKKISKNTVQNPYMRAKMEIFQKMSPWRQQEIVDMENRKDVDNRFYNDFVAEIISLGDSYSP